MAIKKNQSEKKSDFVARQIVEEIQQGNYKVGSQLPSEKEIAKKAGVSRVAVREALSALRLAGIIETKHGEGSYVKSNNEEIIFDYGRWIERNEVNPFAILTVREKIEPALAKLAVDNLNDNSKRQLEKKLDKLADAITSKRLSNCFVVHWELHSKIVELTQNLVAQQVYQPIYRLMVEGYNQKGHWWKVIRKYHESGEHCEGCLSDHRQICEAIINKNKDRVESAFERHFENMGERLSLPGHFVN